MIFNGVEIFRDQSGLTPSLDTQSNETSDCVLVNFDKGEKEGGYISIRLEEGFAYIECFNVHGDIFQDMTVHCSSFNTIGE
jgi:hypothetical protein